jgi:plasmid stabilization system protein ParE
VASERSHFHPEAAEEFEEATRWYSERGWRLAARFLTAIEEATERLCRNPDAYQRIEVAGYDGPSLRRIGVHRFPYGLVYGRTEAGTLLIIAVAPDRREPQYWASRLVGPNPIG